MGRLFVNMPRNVHYPTTSSNVETLGFVHPNINLHCVGRLLFGRRQLAMPPSRAFDSPRQWLKEIQHVRRGDVRVIVILHQYSGASRKGDIEWQVMHQAVLLGLPLHFTNGRVVVKSSRDRVIKRHLPNF